MNDPAASSDALVVEEDHDGLRLDQFLTTILPGQSRSQIQRLIKEGHVTTASGGAVRASTAVHAGERYVSMFPSCVRQVLNRKPCRCASSSKTPMWSCSTSRPGWSSTPGPGTRAARS